MKTKITSIILVCALFMGMLVSMPTTAYASSTAIKGQSTIDQTVYSGPSTGGYVTVGSIKSGEEVFILGRVKNTGWYHIQYKVTQGQYIGKQRTGYVPCFTITNINATVSDEIYTGGLRKSQKNYRVYSCDDSAISVDIGSISANETVTLLYAYQYVDSSKSYLTAYIEYSTSSGTKRGYVYYPEFIEHVAGTNGTTSVARMNSSASVYYGTSTSSYGVAGSIGVNELVCVIAKSGDWVYVEYNSKTGRKRGYLSNGYLDYHRPGLYYADTYVSYVMVSMAKGSSSNVYASPTDKSACIDVLPAGAEITFQTSFNADPSWTYIDYYKTSDSTKKTSGWIYWPDRP